MSVYANVPFEFQNFYGDYIRGMDDMRGDGFGSLVYRSHWYHVRGLG